MSAIQGLGYSCTIIIAFHTFLEDLHQVRHRSASFMALWRQRGQPCLHSLIWLLLRTLNVPEHFARQSDKRCRRPLW